MLETLMYLTVPKGKNLISGVNQQERFKSNFEYPQRLDARTLNFKGNDIFRTL